MTYITVASDQAAANGGVFRQKILLCEPCAARLLPLLVNAMARSESVAKGQQCHRCGQTPAELTMKGGK